MSKKTYRMLVIAFCGVGLLACETAKPSEQPTETPSPAAKQPAAVVVEDAVDEDYDQQAEAEINDSNYEAELDKLEKEEVPE